VSPAERPDRPDDSPGIFPATAHALLLALADAIVPRFGSHPAASEIDLVPRLERSLRLLGDDDFFRSNWSAFAAAILARIPVTSRADAETLRPVVEHFYLEARAPNPGLAARYLEALRWGVLRAYYSSPEGWRAAGYAGPVHRSHPAGGAGVG
jgi:hypothetical protein